MIGNSEAMEEESLPAKYAGIPLVALGPSCRRKLSLYLNLEGMLIESVQCENNYCGIAEQAGFGYLEIKNFEIQKNPTEEMLHEWTVRSELSPTVDRLWNFLYKLGRFDVLMDCQGYIFKDCDAFLEKKAKFDPAPEPIQEDKVTQSTDELSPELMTRQDVRYGTITTYDAFVCYNPEGPDLEFVKQLIKKLEGEFGMKLFVPERDDLAGLPNSTTVAKLIEQRCKKVLIILSPRYLTSTTCDFQTKFAQSLSPGAKEKKLVPILIEQCAVPEILKFVTLVDYTKEELRQWFWGRVANSLQAPVNEGRGSLSSYSSPCSSLYSSTSESSYRSSSSDNMSSIESQPSSSSSCPPRVSKSRSDSPNLISRQEADYIMVERKNEAKHRSALGDVNRPPQVPPTSNRAPLPKSSTPPPSAGSGSPPQQKLFKMLKFSPKSKGSHTAPVNRPLPKPPTDSDDKKDKKGSKEYYC